MTQPIITKRNSFIYPAENLQEEQGKKLYKWRPRSGCNDRSMSEL